MGDSTSCERLKGELIAIRSGLEDVMRLLSSGNDSKAQDQHSIKACAHNRSDFFKQITGPEELPEGGDLYRKVISLITDMGYASTIVLQQRLEVNYRQAGSIIAELERAGLVDSAHGLRPHRVLAAAYEVRERLESDLEEEKSLV